MSSRAKWLTAALTAVLWIAWLTAYAMWRQHPDIGVGHIVATQALQMAAGLSSMVLVLGLLVTPVIRTATVWREIGIKEQQQQCADCPRQAQRAARLTNIIPINFTGEVSRIGNRARGRDN